MQSLQPHMLLLSRMVKRTGFWLSTFGWDETRQPHTVATAASSKTQPVGPAAADDDIAIMDVQQLGS